MLYTLPYIHLHLQKHDQGEKMAKFLDTEAISHEIKQIIKNSTDKIYLMSPYLQVNRRIKEELIDKDKFALDIRLIYGKVELKSDELDWIKELSNLRLYYNEHLHAKCYLNENKAIITSMNLYDYSQRNNVEMGILVDKEDDEKLYKEIYAEVMKIQRNSERTRINIEKIEQGEDDLDENSDMGHCIRCNTNLDLDPTRPYCADCYKTWSKYKNGDYEEKHCHICGKEKKATFNKPVCYDCYKENKDDLNFPEIKKTAEEETSDDAQGHCIRCNKEIKLDPVSPYCNGCYKIWNKYKNEDFEEKHCHICGKGMESTKKKPTCYSCYKEYKGELEFPGS